MPAYYSFTQCDSRQPSHVLLASHQSLLMFSHRGNKHAKLMEVHKHQQRITGVITSLPLGINTKSIKLRGGEKFEENWHALFSITLKCECIHENIPREASCHRCIVAIIMHINKWQSSSSAAILTDLWAWLPISPPSAEHLINCTFNKRKRWWIEKCLALSWIINAASPSNQPLINN